MIINLPLCFRCGVPHIPPEIAERVKNGEQIEVDIVYPSGVAGNVLRWGCGALNIDGCRIETRPRTTHADGNKRTLQSNPYLGTRHADHRQDEELLELDVVRDGALGRWPANVVLSYPEDQYALRRDVTPQQKAELYRWLSENA